MKMLSLLILCAALASCITTKLAVTGSIDRSEKTMAMRQGGGELTTEIKQVLRERGWKIVVQSRPAITVNIVAGKVVSSASDGARYEMEVHGFVVGEAPFAPPVFAFNASVVDRKTNEEVLTANGSRVFAAEAAGSIADALDGKRVK